MTGVVFALSRTESLPFPSVVLISKRRLPSTKSFQPYIYILFRSPTKLNRSVFLKSPKTQYSGTHIHILICPTHTRTSTDLLVRMFGAGQLYASQIKPIRGSGVECLTAINNWLDTEKREERREQVSSSFVGCAFLLQHSSFHTVYPTSFIFQTVNTRTRTRTRRISAALRSMWLQLAIRPTCFSSEIREL